MFPTAHRGTRQGFAHQYCNKALNAPESGNGVLRLTGDPVDSDALHTADAVSDDVLSPRLISLSSANGAQTHVNPIDGVIIYMTTERAQV